MDNQHQIQIIESFLESDISREEALKQGGFSSETAFDQAVENYREGLESIHDLGLEHDLKKIHKKLYTPQKGPVITQRHLMIAASILLFGVFAFLFFQKDSSPDFEAYFEAYPNYNLIRSKDTNALIYGLNLYDQQKFDSAQIVLGALRIDTVNYDYSFYLGITYLANAEFSKSSEILKSIIDVDNTNPYYQQTRWYLALAYWQNEDRQEAVKMLESIERGQFKYEEALELIKALR